MDLIAGMLARSTEKLVEYRPPGKSLNLFERLDYVSVGSMELAFAAGIESLLGSASHLTRPPKMIKMRRVNRTRISHVFEPPYREKSQKQGRFYSFSLYTTMVSALFKLHIYGAFELVGVFKGLNGPQIG